MARNGFRLELNSLRELETERKRVFEEEIATAAAAAWCCLVEWLRLSKIDCFITTKVVKNSVSFVAHKSWNTEIFVVADIPNTVNTFSNMMWAVE